jgi:hypothetical protein
LGFDSEFQRDHRRCFERSIDASLIFRSVLALTSAIATSSARCWKFAQTGKGASWMTFPAESFTDCRPNTLAELLQWNGLGSGLNVLFRPTVKAQRVLAPELGIGRLLLHVLREMFLWFKPDSLKAWVEGYVNFRLRSFLHLHAFEPPGVTGQDLGAHDFLNITTR